MRGTKLGCKKYGFLRVQKQSNGNVDRGKYSWTINNGIRGEGKYKSIIKVKI